MATLSTDRRIARIGASGHPGSDQIEVDRAGVSYGDLWALREVSFTVAAGERIAVVGPSGAGKSTLLALLNGTVAPGEGSVRVFGQELGALSGSDLSRTQARIGTVHQHFDLVGPLRVIHNVNAGRLTGWSTWRAVRSLIRPAEVAGSRDALARVGMGGRIYERTDRLSGGERQRVALARMLVQNPDAILADEPISNLDPVRGEEVMDLLRDLSGELGKTLISSIHRFEYALSHFDRVIGLREGQVLFDLPSSEVTEQVARELYRISPR
ncbi:MAG: phosphonate ABC transporter ATP-binding protein [Actinomycetota bacterium]